ncbi:MAG: trigger factor [Bdellovibrionales bacterium]|nr:trigger factor [Bdellovibrionales bacterium]
MPENIKVKIDSVSSVEKKLSISVPEDYVQAELEKAYRDANQKAKIPGFRKGKVPRSVLEKRFGPSIEAEVLQDVIRGTVTKAMEDHKLDAIYVSEIMEPKRVKGEGFSYIASIEVKPEIEPKAYTGVKIEGEKLVIDENKVNEALKHLLESQAVLKPIENATKVSKGNFVTLSVSDLTTNPPKESKDQIYEVGSENARKEIDQALASMKIGESQAVTFEDEKSKKKYDIQISLKAIKEKVLPELTDEFAKSVGPFETLKDLKDHLEKELKVEADAKMRSGNIRKILDSILEKNPVELPKTLVHHEVERLCKGVEQRMKEAGIEKLPEDYSHEKMHTQLQPDAEKNVHEQIVLEAIARKEDITVENEEIMNRLKQQAEASRIPISELKAYYDKSGGIEDLGFQLLVQKTLDFLLTKANIK